MFQTNVMPLKRDLFLDHFQSQSKSLPGRGLDWLDGLRAQQMALYSQSGLPSPRQEDWKFTNLALLNKAGLVAATGGELRQPEKLPFLLEGSESYRFVFIAGRFEAELSSPDLPEGVSFESLAEALCKGGEGLKDDLTKAHHKGDTPLVALNTALMSDGFLLNIAENTRVGKAIEILHLGSVQAGQSWHSRNLIRVGARARVTILENYVDLDVTRYFENAATSVEVAEGASLHHYKLQNASKQAFLISHARALVGAEACYDAFLLNSGARLARNDIAVQLREKYSSCHINGAYMVDGDQHCDITTHIDHLAPNTACDEVFKGVLNGKSRGVFQGKIVVHQGAQKTVGNQSNRVLLLSDEAEVNAKPELEIFADDVICSHGCTSGRMDDAQLFYMRARGLDEETAQRLLVKAFLAEAVEEMQDESLKDLFNTRLDSWLDKQKET